MALILAVISCSDRGVFEPAATPTSPLFTHVPGLPAVRISEIHYDNTGTDADERIEISGPAGTSVEGWKVYLYNGSGGVVYESPAPTKTLTGVIPATCDTRGVIVLDYPINGIQNGAPDGIALVDASGHVVEFLSYEGSFTATNGPASGLTSTDIGASQGGSEPLGSSLQRSGSNVWTATLGTNTFGACNDADETPPPPVPTVPATRFSEIHYDNTGTDVGERIEISGPVGASVAGWKVYLYNGSNGATYEPTKTLTGTIPDNCLGPRGVIVLSYTSNQIQNGSPDGMAFVDAAGNLVEFLSYEGTFTATNGPAAGEVSKSIGVAQNGTEPLESSLQRNNDNVWNATLGSNTFGACNDAPSTATVLINELMADPHQAAGGASWGEWFEVHNYGTEAVDLKGWRIVSNGQPNHTIGSNVIVPAGGFAVLGRGADLSLNGGVTIDYNYFTGTSSTIFLDANDCLTLRDASGTDVDSVCWTSSAIVKGVTRALRDPSVGNSDANGTNWGYSTTTFGDGDFGTPDAANGTLSDTPPIVPNTIRFSGRVSSDPPLPVGFEDQLFVTLMSVNGAAVETEWTLSTLTPSIASIDDEGVIRALAAGTATFRATATVDGSTRTYSLPTRVAIASTTAQYGGNTEFGVPTDSDPSDDFILERAQYTTSYNKTRGTPNWVSYNIDATHFGTEDRCDCFTFDDALPATFPRYKTSDYTSAGAFHGYGIDRGHLARSFDRTSASLDNANTFYFSNIIPQAADNNQGPWAALETHLGNLARFNNKEIYVIAGVAGSKGTVKGEGKIVIPASTWKVAVILPRNSGLDDVGGYADPEVIAVIMPNDPGIRTVNWETYRKSVNKVEQVSGYDLLALLSDDIEAAVESGVQTVLVPVEDLVADGKLSKGNGNALTVKLEHAARLLDGGHTTPAVNQLEAFLHHVDDLQAEGKLSAADASALRAAATQVIESGSN